MMASVQPIIYRFGAFVLDPGNRALRSVEGREIPLRPRSYALLQLLVENAGQLITREAILSALWPNMFVTQDSVTQCVHDVRRALGPDGAGVLRTMNRRGYLFAAEVRAEPLPPRPAAYPDGERAEISVMSSDVRGFTALSETSDPTALARITTIYFKALTDELRAGGATIGKCVNDSVMAYWGAKCRSGTCVAGMSGGIAQPRCHSSPYRGVRQTGLAATADNLRHSHRQGSGRRRLPGSSYGSRSHGQPCQPARGTQQAIWDTHPRY
jgi:DNA-binding winged helix-turn-helix (wHTH) protein